MLSERKYLFVCVCVVIRFARMHACMYVHTDVASGCYFQREPAEPVRLCFKTTVCIYKILHYLG